MVWLTGWADDRGVSCGCWRRFPVLGPSVNATRSRLTGRTTSDAKKTICHQNWNIRRRITNFERRQQTNPEDEWQCNDDVNYGTTLRSVQRLGYKSQLQGNMFRFRTVWNVLTNADVWSHIKFNALWCAANLKRKLQRQMGSIRKTFVCSSVEASWNVMAHAQKPDFVFPQNGRVHLNRRGCQFFRLLAAKVCASAVVMLDTPCSDVVRRVLATHSIR